MNPLDVHRTRRLVTAAVFLTLWCSGSGRRPDAAPDPAGPTAQPPNIVFVLADDLGWAQLGSYGSTYYETPHIDRLAEQGLRFTNAYAAAAVCSPTRASLMTGQYPARLHLTDFIAGGQPPDGSPLAHPDWSRYLPLEAVTIAEVLREAGYATASFGKWHLSQAKTPPESKPFNPDRQGFGESFVTYKPVPSMAQPWQDAEEDAHNVGIITRKSLDFIERHQERPFFLLVSHNSIHDPLVEKAALIEKYAQKPASERPENNPVIAAMLETLDASVGRLSAHLDSLQLTDRTLFVFYSDNGGLDRAGQSDRVIALQTPLRAGKAELYEGGIRVPLVVRWPGVVAPGTTSGEPVSSIDFFPTLTEAAGAPAAETPIDGISLMPLLSGAGALDRDALFWHYPHYHSAGAGPSGAIREGSYKLIEWYEAALLGRADQVELYNLDEDPGEQVNLAAEHPDRVDAMRTRLHAWREAVDAQMPVVH